MKMPRGLESLGVFFLACHPGHSAGVAFLVLSGKNFLILFHQLFHFHGAVGGGGGGKLYGFDAGCFFAVLFVEFVGGGACAKNALDFRFGEERCNVVGNYVFDARVACANDGATVKNVP